MEEDVRNIPLDQLHDPYILLRPVDRASLEYLELRDSYRERGLLDSISVRPSTRQPGKFEIIDGMWRVTAGRDIGRETIPCIVKHGISDDDVLALQIHANAIRPKTKPTEFARQLRRIFDRKPGMTFAELATIVRKGPNWVSDRLGLLWLDDETQLMVDRGEIPVSNAYMLAKIQPVAVRAEYVERARTMRVDAFKALAAGVIKRFGEAVQAGKMDARYLTKHEPIAHQRSIKDVKSELDNPKIGALLLASEGCTTPLEIWNAALRWTLHLDRDSAEEQVRAAQFKEAARFIKHKRKPRHDPLAEN